MTDYQSIEKLEVYRGDDQVGELARLARGCEYRYSKAFLQSNERPIALHLPKTAEPLVTEGILNLPTFFAGLLPEGVMLSAAQKLIGSAKDDLFAVLAATGWDAIGDVSVRVPGAPPKAGATRNLVRAKAMLEEILSGNSGQIDAISAIAGVQPKLSIGSIVRASLTATFIAKFPSPDLPGLPENEFACMTLAHRCGLVTPRARLESGVYVVDRFDRMPGGDKLHVEDLLQVMNLFPHSKYAVDFVEVCDQMARLGVSKAGILDATRIYALSWMVGNGDLHAKNLSLVRKANGQWTLSPAYDIVSTLPYREAIAGAETMAIALADEAIGRFEAQDFVAFAARFDIPQRAVTKALKSLGEAVLRHAPGLLASVLAPSDLDLVLARADKLMNT